RETLAIQQRVLGPEHPLTIRSRTSLSDLLYLRELVREAEMMERETLAICERTLGPKHFLTTGSQAHLAEYVQEHSPGEALELLERAVQNGVDTVVRASISADNFPALRGNHRFETLVREIQQSQSAR